MVHRSTDVLRVGILGAAHVAPAAVIEPARELGDVVVHAVAARGRSRADAFATAHGVPMVASSYADLVGRDDLDAVYIALPASEHLEWTSRALAAGKHVLCEKPLVTSAADAERLVDQADGAALVLAEAMHYRYHPMAERLIDIVRSGVLGSIRRVTATHLNAVPSSWPVYWDRTLGGGATWHTGVYPAHCVRAVTGEEPIVRQARAQWRSGVDASLLAEIELPSGATGTIESSMIHEGVPSNSIQLVGERGVLDARNFIVPHYGLRYDAFRSTVTLHVDAGNGRTLVDRFDLPTTYRCQLEAFTRAVAGEATLPTGGADAIANARLLEAMLAAAA